MAKPRLFSNLMISLMLVVQTGGAGVAFADTAPATTTTTTVAPATGTTDPTITTTDPATTPADSSVTAPPVATVPDPATTTADTSTPATTTTTSDPAAPALTSTKPQATTVAPAKPVIGAPATTGAPTCGGVIPNWVYDTTIPQWVAADQASFQCDMTSGYYLSTKYYYDKQTGWYEIIPASAPKPDYMITAPSVVHTVLGDLVVGSKDYQIASALGLLNTTNGIMMTNPGSASVMASGQAGTNAPGGSSTGQSWFDMTSLVNVMTALQSTAQTGNVAANSNTQVGNAVTGAATVIANLINLLSSAWSWSNGGLNYFISNLFGNNTGDINLNLAPASGGTSGALGNTASVAGPTGTGSTNQAGIVNNGGVTVNGQTTGNIVNNVDLAAQSGNATAGQNTVAGNVATGDATAMVDIINLINSYISSGSSFFGILNIFGNLNGDILFPNGFLNGALANGTGGANTASVGGTGPDSTNQAAISNNNPTTVNNTVSNQVNNNILTSAASGSANVSANTASGNVATGSAQTNQSLFNLSNTSLFSDNAVLVIVNVLGHWVGKIMSLPGANTSGSALLTSNAQSAPLPSNTASVAGPTGASSTNQATIDNSQPTAVNLQTSGTITNNVNVGAQSGNAAATQNTAVGDVSTGNAKAASSIANIFNTVLNVKHWFGVLIVNVFGSWIGDVGNNTAAGDQPAATGSASAAPAANPKVFVAALVGLRPGSSFANRSDNTAVAASDQATGNTGSVLADSASTSPLATVAAHLPVTTATQAATQTKNSNLLFMIAAAFLLMAGALNSIERRLRRA